MKKVGQRSSLAAVPASSGSGDGGATGPAHPAGNIAPVIYILSASPNPSHNGSTANIKVEVSGFNSDVLTYVWTLPAGFVLESGADTSEITVKTPTQLTGGNVQVAVSDGIRTIIGSICLSTLGAQPDNKGEHANG